MRLEATFKETKLTHMRKGQEVTVVADARPDTLSALR
jgi:multidrug resistance efflux pump